VLALGERANQPAALCLRQARIGRVADQRVPEQADLSATVLIHLRFLLPALSFERGSVSAHVAHD
jgi:hypothetical protein